MDSTLTVEARALLRVHHAWRLLQPNAEYCTRHKENNLSCRHIEVLVQIRSKDPSSDEALGTIIPDCAVPECMKGISVEAADVICSTSLV